MINSSNRKMHPKSNISLHLLGSWQDPVKWTRDTPPECSFSII
jgi:hypothetical protein